MHRKLSAGLRCFRDKYIKEVMCTFMKLKTNHFNKGSKHTKTPT
jgi:hypothetical protein